MKAEALAQWDVLRLQLAGMKAAKQMEMITEYKNKYQQFACENADKAYQNASQFIAFEQEIADFMSFASQQKAEIASRAALQAGKSSTIQQVRSNMILLLRKEEFPRQKSASLKRKDEYLTDEERARVRQYMDELTEKAMELRQKMLAERRARQAEEKRQEGEKVFRRYCGELPKIQTRAQAKSFLEKLAQWEKEYGTPAGDTLRDLQIIRRILPDALTTDSEFLHQIRRKLAGSKWKHYRFLDADEKGLICAFETNGSLVTTRISWSEIKQSSEKSDSVLRSLCGNPALIRKLSAEEQELLFKKFLTERHPEVFYQEYLSEAHLLTVKQKQHLQDDAAFFARYF